MILAFETASEIGGVALAEGGVLLGERVLGAGGRQHAAELLVALDALLAETGRSLDRVESIALSIGPGSFTGLRIGLATALGLCFGTERTIVPVPTLAALSLQAGEAGPIVPMLDARRGQVYTGIYAPGGVALCEDAVLDPLPWLEQLRALEGGDPVTLLGPGARLYQNEIRTVLGARARLLDAEAGELRARSVARLGEPLLREGAALPPGKVALCYLRPAEAEQKRCALHGPGKPIS